MSDSIIGVVVNDSDYDYVQAEKEKEQDYIDFKMDLDIDNAERSEEDYQSERATF